MATATELAQEAMKQAVGDVLEATALLEKLARSDHDVWQTLTEQLLRTACYESCASICRAERRVIWNSPGYDAGGKGGRIKEHSLTLMDWPLPGGKRLRDATKSDLMEAAQFYRSQAAQMETVAVWLTAIADQMKRKTVGATLTDAQLKALKDDPTGIKRAAA